MLTQAEILDLSIYSQNINVEHLSFGKHATVYKGSPDSEHILKDEMKRKNAEIGPDARLLVTGRYYTI
jgi:hypothetical protein